MPKRAVAFGAGVGDHTNQDEALDSPLDELEVEIALGDAALGPALQRDDVAFYCRRAARAE